MTEIKPCPKCRSSEIWIFDDDGLCTLRCESCREEWVLGKFPNKLSKVISRWNGGSLIRDEKEVKE